MNAPQRQKSGFGFGENFDNKGKYGFFNFSYFSLLFSHFLFQKRETRSWLFFMARNRHLKVDSSSDVTWSYAAWHDAWTHNSSEESGVKFSTHGLVMVRNYSKTLGPKITRLSPKVWWAELNGKIPKIIFCSQKICLSESRGNSASKLAQDWWA